MGSSSSSSAAKAALDETHTLLTETPFKAYFTEAEMRELAKCFVMKKYHAVSVFECCCWSFFFSFSFFCGGETDDGNCFQRFFLTLPRYSLPPEPSAKRPSPPLPPLDGYPLPPPPPHSFHLNSPPLRPPARPFGAIVHKA